MLQLFPQLGDVLVKHFALDCQHAQALSNLVLEFLDLLNHSTRFGLIL